jgi:drug/metabolite transporter (DMT)-like permease
MTLGVFSFAIVDASTRLLRVDYDYGTWQIMLLTRVPPLLVALYLAAQATGNPFALKTRFPLTHLGRGICVMLTTATFFAALKFLPLADCIVIAFAAPIFVTALSGPLLREKVGWRRWSAVGIGFLGVLLAVKPGSAIGLGTILVLVSALTYALTLLSLRPLSGKESTHNILFYSTAFTLLSAVVPGILEWKPVGFAAGGLMVLQGLASASGQLCMVKAFRTGEASMLAPIEFTALVWAVLFGYVFWGNLPGIEVLVGAALIIGANLYIAQREARLANRPALSPVPEHASVPE